jgi:hypothetical protein
VRTKYVFRDRPKPVLKKWALRVAETKKADEEKESAKELLRETVRSAECAGGGVAKCDGHRLTQRLIALHHEPLVLMRSVIGTLAPVQGSAARRGRAEKAAEKASAAQAAADKLAGRSREQPAPAVAAEGARPAAAAAAEGAGPGGAGPVP